MSYVADVIFITMIDENIDHIQNYLEKTYSRKLIQVDDYAGGNKAIQASVYMIAINYMDIKGFLNTVFNHNYEDPECVQVLIHNENDDLFTSYDMSSEQLTRD